MKCDKCGKEVISKKACSLCYSREYNKREDVIEHRKKLAISNEYNKKSRERYNEDKEKSREIKKRYYENYKEIILEKLKEYREKPEVKLKRLKKQRDYYKKNKEALNKSNKKRYIKNRDIYSFNRKSENLSEERLDLVRSGRREFHSKNKNNVEYMIKKRLRGYFFIIFKKFLFEKKLKSEKYGIDWNWVIKHLEIPSDNLEKYHLDHIIPISYFTFVHADNSKNLIEIKKAWSPMNLRFIKKEENLKKRDNVDLIKYPLRLELLDKL